MCVCVCVGGRGVEARGGWGRGSGTFLDRDVSSQDVSIQTFRPIFYARTFRPIISRHFVPYYEVPFYQIVYARFFFS